MGDTNPIEITEQMKVVFHQAFKNDKNNLQEAISALRKSGFSQMESLFVLVSEMNVGFQQANNWILNSDAWNS